MLNFSFVFYAKNFKLQINLLKSCIWRVAIRKKFNIKRKKSGIKSNLRSHDRIIMITFNILNFMKKYYDFILSLV